MSVSSNGDLDYNENIRRTSEGYASELNERFLHDSSCYSPEELNLEVTKMSAKKAQELFVTEDDRKVWIESVRSSVELSLQSQVRAVLGTPPDVKRKRRERKQQEDTNNPSYLKTNNLNSKARNYSFLGDSDDRFKFERDKIRPGKIQHESSQQTLVSQSTYLDPLSDDFNKIFSPYTRAALQNVSHLSSNTNRKQPPQPFKRAPASLWVDSQGVEHELPGPFWPKDHLPLYSNQKHLKSVPSLPEPLHTPGTQGVVKEENPDLFPKQWKGSAVVYDRSNIKLCPTAPTGCLPNLKFESRFECGNLQQSKRVGQCEYDLILTTDLYTKRHTQWYYFQVENMVSGVTYKFNIVNLLKKDSLYNYGMKPLLYSQKLAENDNMGWRRAGHSISYTRNISPKYNPLLAKEQAYYILSFQMEFAHSSDVCYLAHCYPYSYSDLELYLRTLVDSPTTSQHVRKEVLCKTRAGNSCHVLTVTSSKVADNKKLGVVISARVHPGETNASWMMKGVMDYLTSNDPVAESLRQKFVFKIVPMLNPDGVVVGNYRTNLAAKDLNRTFKEPDKNNFPTVWHTKSMLESFKENHQVIIYCDLHGHSRKPNVFMYGCTADPSMGSVSNFLEERLFPWMMSQKAPDKFSFQGCKFLVRKCKESTARVVMWKQLGIMNSFTMEATFCGANFGDMEKGRHFNTHDFEDMGRHFCEVLMEYSEVKNANRNEMTQAFVELACKMTRDILRQTLGSVRRLNDGNIANKPLTCSKSNENKQNANQIEQGKVQFMHSSKQGIKIAPTVKDVNLVDVNVQRSSGSRNNSQVAKNGSGDYDVAVKSIHVDSFNDCIKILEGLRLTQCYEESDSSDSDSEPEAADGSLKKGNETKRRKKKKRRKQNWWETLSKTAQEANKDNQNAEEEQAKPEERKIKNSFAKFVNPYANRFNNGIPVYSQERIRERAKKKEMEKEAEEKEKAEVQANGDISSSSESVIAFTDNTELNFVTAQRRLTYYMMNRPKPTSYVRSLSHPNMTVVPNRKETMVSPSFKMDHLDGGGYGFAIKFPASEQGRGESLKRHQRHVRAASLQSFEEARSVNGSPSFIEVDSPDFVPLTKGVVEQRTRNVHKSERNRDNASYRDYTRSDGNSIRDLETMLRLVHHNGEKQFDLDANYKEDLQAEFDKLNIRRRRHQKRLLRTPTNNTDREPSVNNRSTVDLRMPFYPSYEDCVMDEKWSRTEQESSGPRFEPSAPIPSYSAVGFSSPTSLKRHTYK